WRRARGPNPTPRRTCRVWSKPWSGWCSYTMPRRSRTRPRSGARNWRRSGRRRPRRRSNKRPGALESVPLTINRGGVPMTEETLFALALEKSTAAERRAFLDAACGEDLRLRDRVEQLLAADQRSRGILEQSPDAAALREMSPSETDTPDRSPHVDRFAKILR